MPRTTKSAAKRSDSKEFTIGQALWRLIPRLRDDMDRDMPLWPPDVFCLCASLLQLSGAYSLILHQEHAPDRPHLRQDQLKEAAKVWEKVMSPWVLEKVLDLDRPPQTDFFNLTQYINKGYDLAHPVTMWGTIKANFDVPVERLLSDPKRELKPNHKTVLRHIFDLFALADELSENVHWHRNNPSSYSILAQSRLAWNFYKGRSSLCWEVDSSRASVLPKIHTPRNGITMRNLSNYLAYLRVSEMRPLWFPHLGDGKEAGVYRNEHVNILIIPWPDRVDPVQFKAASFIPVGVPRSADGDGSLAGASVEPDSQFGLFTYDQGKCISRTTVKKLIQACRLKAGSLHGIVFPESAMSEQEFDDISLARLMGSGQSDLGFLIAGVGTPPRGPIGPNARFPNKRVKPGLNRAFVEQLVTFGEVTARAQHKQDKHHRWKLDGSQIRQYGLGGRLDPMREWWEFIQSESRSVAFIGLRSWLTTSVLVCEDLARPDPVGSTLRAVAPNLIVSLLLDGPQLEKRWPGRYATVLADDPGASVLTVTSLGMARLSSVQLGTQTQPQCIALWKDALNGVKEITIPQGASGILITLSPEKRCEYSADGRHKPPDLRTAIPVLTGIHPIFLPESAGRN